MSIRSRSISRKSLFVSFCLIQFAAAAYQPTVRAVDSNSPSPAEKEAVALMAEKGSVIFIDGEYQVTQIFGGRELINEDLRHLQALKKLRSLSLSSSKINDGALDRLKVLTQLQSLTLPAGSLSDQSHEALKKALPNCRITLPDRRGFGTPGGTSTKSTAAANSFPSPPGSWGAFEYPPMIPAPSISAEIHSAAVQDRLKLTAEQKRQIDRVTGREYQRQQTEEAIKKLLSSEQMTAMKQVLLQREGPTALVLPEVAQDLKLTNEQRAAIQKIMDERRKDLISIGEKLRERTIDFAKSGKETHRVNTEANDRLLAVLTPSQREAWKAKIGPPLPTPQFGPFGRPQTPEESARSTFRNLDRNSDGQLSAEEWHRSRNTRTRFENAKIALELPIKVDAFVERYLQLESPSESVPK